MRIGAPSCKVGVQKNERKNIGNWKNLSVKQYNLNISIRKQSLVTSSYGDDKPVCRTLNYASTNSYKKRSLSLYESANNSTVKETHKVTESHTGR